MTQVGLFIVGEANSNFMKKKIFKFILNILSDEDLNNIAYGETENGEDMIYLFSNIKKHEELYNLLKKHDVLISYKNLTSAFLYQKDLNPIFNGGIFKEILVNFLNNNLEKDVILDKINDLGIESLNEVDYKILQK